MRSVPSARSASSAAAYALPSGLHKDPADRILAATARMQDLTLLTADERLTVIISPVPMVLVQVALAKSTVLPTDFRRKVLTQLQEVLRLYPTVRVSQTDTGLRLYPSPPHVQGRARRQATEMGLLGSRSINPPSAPPAAVSATALEGW